MFRLYKKEECASGLMAFDFPGSYHPLGRRRRFVGNIIASSFVFRFHEFYLPKPAS